MKSLNRAWVVSPLAALMALAAVHLISGCSGPKSNGAAQPPPSAFTVKSGTNLTVKLGGNTNLVIQPAASAVGRVFSVNNQGKFVVVTFPVGQLPVNDTRFSVFRAGTKVGEIKITIPPAPVGSGVSADIIAGSAEEGDEVRSE